MVGGRTVVPFDAEPWLDEAEGVRALVRDVEGIRWAVVEYLPGAGRPDWCTTGHRGYVVAGEIEYEFESGGSLTARTGQGFVLPGGDGHRGRNRGGEPARLLVIDERTREA
jgi:quercetin dioxygenase-like cupin family protein